MEQARQSGYSRNQIVLFLVLLWEPKKGSIEDENEEEDENFAQAE